MPRARTSCARRLQLAAVQRVIPRSLEGGDALVGLARVAELGTFGALVVALPTMLGIASGNRLATWASNRVQVCMAVDGVLWAAKAAAADSPNAAAAVAETTKRMIMGQPFPSATGARRSSRPARWTSAHVDATGRGMKLASCSARASEVQRMPAA